MGLVVMAALAAPFLSVQFGTPDAGNHPRGTATRAAHDLTARAFGPGANGHLLIVVNRATAASTARVTEALASADGIASTTPALTSTDGQASLITAVPATGPQDKRTTELVERLRNSVLPAAMSGTASTAHVGGTTAATLDSDANVVRRIPLLVTLVVGISLLLLLVAFRSVAIAAKAAVLNLLSVAAAYGVVALVLQGGWAGQLVGIDSPTPLPAFVPVLMFAVLFSLSADYEIFLVSRMRDAYKRSRDTGDAIAAGLAGTAGVITAAAAVMIAVFAAFVPSTDVAVKVIGVGMAAAILIDATVVRMLLVPSIMHILGDGSWWMPTWLERRLPEFAVEGHEQDYLPQATADPLAVPAQAAPRRYPDMARPMR
jgi:RND superfamily putative drug exporter